MTNRKRTVVLYSSSLLILIMVILGWLSGISSCLLQHITQTLAEGFHQEIEDVMRRMKEQNNSPMMKDSF